MWPILWLFSFFALVKSMMENVDETRFDEGQKQLQVLKRETQMPRYGLCWTKALEDLQRGCQDLTDDEQSYLALALANCFLEKTGMKTYPCSRDQAISQCLEGVDHNAYSTFSNFFTHTQNMCYFLQSQVWHQETKATVNKLSKVSSDVAKRLDHSSELQAKIMENQIKTIEYHEQIDAKTIEFHEKFLTNQVDVLEFQRQIAENGTLMSNAIEASKQNVREILEEFKSSTDEQKMLIFEIFDRVSKLQNLVVSEVSWLYTVVFYGSCLLVVFLVSATQRTSEARLWLYLVLSINFLFERAICQWSLSSNTGEVKEEDQVSANDINDLPETIYNRIWIIRKLSMTLCFLITFFKAVTFVDYNKVNNVLLEDIRKQNATLKQRMEMIQIGTRDNNYNPVLARHDSIDHVAISSGLDSGINGDIDHCGEEFSSDDDDTLSFNSTQTDRTWMAKEDRLDEMLSEESSDEENTQFDQSFFSALGSQNPSPDIIESVHPDSAHLESSSGNSNKAKSVSSSRKSSRSSTPMADGNPHRYNLRCRKSQGNLKPNPILNDESPETFGKLINKFASITKRNNAKLNMALKNQAKQTNYSSDDNE